VSRYFPFCRDHAALLFSLHHPNVIADASHLVIDALCYHSAQQLPKLRIVRVMRHRRGSSPSVAAPVERQEERVLTLQTSGRSTDTV